MIYLNLPYGPTVNHYWGQARNGRRFLTKKAQIFRMQVATEVLSNSTYKNDCLENDLNFSMVVWPPDNRKRDLDNLVKPIWDALEHSGLIKNDSQFKHMHCIMKKHRKDYPKGRIEVLIREIEEIEDARP